MCIAFQQVSSSSASGIDAHQVEFTSSIWTIGMDVVVLVLAAPFLTALRVCDTGMRDAIFGDSQGRSLPNALLRAFWTQHGVVLLKL